MTTATTKNPAPRIPARLRDLVRLMDTLIEQYRRLLEVLQAKLLSMRRSDTEQMQIWVEQEMAMTRQIRQTEGLWRQMLTALGRDWGLPEAQASRLSIGALTPYLDSPRLAMVRGRGVQLSQLSCEVGKVNTVIKMIGQELQKHYRWIFQQITSGMEDSGVYSPVGEQRLGQRAQMVDATG